MTLQGTLTNSQHDYLVAINDFEFTNNGEDFYASMSSINVLNQLQSYDISMVGNSGSMTEAYYFFGCLEISSGDFLWNIMSSYSSILVVDGTFEFVPAPQGVFFDGDSDSNWFLMRDTYC